MFPQIQLAVLAGRGEHNPALERWARRFDHWRIFRGGGLPDHLACRRNAIVDWFLGGELAELWMIDGDMVPIDAATAKRLGISPTDRLAEATAPAACNIALARAGHVAHGHDGLSAASLKATRQLLAAMGAPWFRFTYNRELTKVLACECSYFARRARGAAARIGLAPPWIAHAGLGAAAAGPDGRPVLVLLG